MKEFALYLGNSALSIAILYGAYWLFLRKDTFFSINRMYLMGTIILSLLLPAFNFNFGFSSGTGNFAYVLQTITVQKESLVNEAANNLELIQVFFIVWLTGVAIFLFRFLFQVLQLLRLMKRYGVTRHEGIALVLMDSAYSPFSFFNITFLNRELKPEEFSQILAHERIHVKQYHSADIVLLELLTIIQWFNPFVWFVHHSLKAIHEYLADEGVLLDGHKKVNYQELLLSMTMGVRVNDLTNNFNISLIKRRFIMMTKNRSGNLARLKNLFILPVAIALVVFLSCNKVDKVQQNESKLPISTSNTNASNKAVDESANDMIPEFPGGQEALTDFILKNVNYPEAAKKAGIQGKVSVSFTIDKTGKVKDVTIEEGVSPDLDNEALRVIKKMPAWKPGKTEDTKMTLPIQFKLACNSKMQLLEIC